MGHNKRAGEPLNKTHTWDVTFPQRHQTPHMHLFRLHPAQPLSTTSPVQTYTPMPPCPLKISTLWKGADVKDAAVGA